MTGIVCSSWVYICRGTSGRKRWKPLGDQSKDFVKNGNLMVSRLAVILRILHAKGVFVIVEQPASSLMIYHPRLQGLIKNDIKLYQVRV